MNQQERVFDLRPASTRCLQKFESFVGRLNQSLTRFRRGRRVRLLSGLLFISVVLFGAETTARAVTEFPIPTASSFPEGITAGPDGALWFTEFGADKIGRITTGGIITEFPLSLGAAPLGITAGPDGNLWFTEAGSDRIGRITPAGVITEFILAAGSAPPRITTGPDGNMWFTEPGTTRIARLNPSAGSPSAIQASLVEFIVPGAGSQPFGIIAAADGNLWFTEFASDEIGRITPAGVVIAEFPLPAGSGPNDITTGPDAKLYFTEFFSDKIGRIDPGAGSTVAIQATLTHFPTGFNTVPGGQPIGITQGSDGNLWITGFGSSQLGRMTTTGSTKIFDLPFPNSGPSGITPGPNGSLWFTESGIGKIGTLNPNLSCESQAFRPNSIFLGPIADAAGGSPNIPAITYFNLGVNLNSTAIASIGDLDVLVNITHPALNELKLELIAPDTTIIRLVSNRTDAAGGTHVGGVTGANLTDTVFDEQAALSITAGTAPFTGHFRPEEPLSTFTGMTAAQASGVWTLRITDFRNGNVGALNNWALTFANSTLSINNATVTEGDSGSTNAVFTVTLSQPSNATVTVDYFTSNGTATEPSDYTAVNGTLTFAPGQTTRTISVPVNGDTIPEANETFFVNLMNATNASGCGAGPGTGTINDNDVTPPPPATSISINNVTVTEGDSGTTSAVFTVTLSAANAVPVAVDYLTSNGTAIAPADYQFVNGTLTFSPGQTTRTITVPIVGDTVAEPSETFFVGLMNPTNATISTPQGTGTITDNDPPPPPPPSMTINNATVTEGDSGTTSAVFNVTLSAASTQIVAVDYLTLNGTATDPGDYQFVNGTLTFSPGQTLRTITVPIVGDTVAEPSETFFVSLMNPTNATIATPQGTGTINDNDASGVFQFSSGTATVAENANPGSVTLTVTRTGDTSGVASVGFETSDGVAIQKKDYTFGYGTIQFGPGDNSKTFTVLIVNDVFVEGGETFQVHLLNPSGNFVIGSPGSTVVTITDDDTVPPVANPIDNAQFFVRQHYLDFLGREADAAGLAFWTGQITACGANASCVAAKRVDVSASFFLSIEFQETGGYALRIQRAAFGRQSNDPTTRYAYLDFMRDSRTIGQGVIVGQPGFDALLEQNKQAYASGIVADPLFTARFPIQPGPNYVDALFASAGVTPTAAERTAAINAFGAGGTAGRVLALRSVSDSASVRTAEARISFVLSEYYGYLRRNPTDAPDFSNAGYQFWLDKLNFFNGNYIDAEMVKAFITSLEYRGRFGP